jgi:L-amino acid N-acyltransferase YncA
LRTGGELAPFQSLNDRYHRRMAPLKPVIRPAEASDAAAVVSIYAPYVLETAVSFEAEPPTAATMAQRINGTLQTHPWLVAERHGEGIVGYAYAGQHNQRAAYRWTVDLTVYVGGQMRRSGVGRALYLVFLETLRRQGFRSAFAEIVLPNPDSVRLHERAGFKPIGVHKDIGFKLGRWHDIGYWRLGLTDGVAPPSEPIPFAAFKETASFGDLLCE